ncbi:MAG: glycosyltransferase family 4 protein [Alphaproteobacteria bacterium]|nr:glycosyltransferase family 4 protein [Alphaproteobacteria bacterium]
MDSAYVILDGYFSRTHGRPSSSHLGYENFWSRYTRVFSRVTVITRVGDRNDPSAMPMEGPGLNVLALPDKRSFFSFLLYIPRLLLLLWRLPRDAAYILRVPGFITALAWGVLVLRRTPFGVEVMADPADVMARGASRQPFQSLLRLFLVWTTKRQCLTAVATAYVTSSALQKAYPPAASRPTFSFTSLNLHDPDFAECPRRAADFSLEHPVLVNVAMMQKTIKGQDVALKAFAKLRRSGVEAELVLVGDGDYRPFFERMAEDLGMAPYVTFAGLLPKGPALIDVLDRADLFVLPSRQEGLPRAMLEAMARGLPCVASDVGGTSELVPKEDLVPKDDIDALFGRLQEILADPEGLARRSARNLEVARGYHADRVAEKRTLFYTVLKQARRGG